MPDEPTRTPVPQLETPRLVLRQLGLHDAAAIFAYASDPEVARYTFWHAHQSLEDSHRFITWLTSGEVACWAIVLRAHSTLIGTCFLHSFNQPHRRAEIAFNVARREWGQGYATEAVRAVLQAGFMYWQLNRIEGTSMLANSASARVMEKAGMHFEGILRQYAFAKGTFHDMKLYAALQGGEWSDLWEERRGEGGEGGAGEGVGA